METLDNEGYPTDELLDYIRNFSIEDDIMEFLGVISESWMYSKWGFILKRKYGSHQKLELHTGGWSGNEDIISAMLSNSMLMFKMGYYMWRTGGHYYFKIRTVNE